MPTPRPTGRRRIFLLVLLAGSLLFVFAGLGMLLSGASDGLPGVLFFGVCAAVFIWQLRPDRFENQPRSASLLLSQYPGPIVLRASPRKLIFLAVVGLVFGSVGLWTLLRDDVPTLGQIMLWPGVVLFIGSAPVILAIALRGSTLVLEVDHLVMTHIGRAHRMPWSNLSDFTVATVAVTNRMVVFNDAAVSNTQRAGMNRALTKRSSALPDTYGFSADELAVMLSSWCERARQGNR